MTIIERGMQPLEVTDVKSYQVEKLHFRFAHFGWMNVYLHDMVRSSISNYGAGELVIHSDWGTWAYIWSGIDEGETFREFLVKADCDYLTRKLMGGYTNMQEWDPEATKVEIAKKIKEDTEGAFTRSVRASGAGVPWSDVLLEQLEQCDWDSGLLFWAERMEPDLCEFLGAEPWEYAVMKQSSECCVLKEQLLPVIKSYLKERNSK